MNRDKSSTSIKAKLLILSKETRGDFDALLLLYFQERFLYRLAISEFSGEVLKKAIESTLKKRQTVIQDVLYVFREKFQNDRGKQQQWAAFLRKTRIDKSNHDFHGIMKRITDFLEPVIISIKEREEMKESWEAAKGIWVL